MSRAGFDALAADYDRSFTDTRVGRSMRDAAWRRLDALFAPGDHVLEIACGTGEDAVHLARRGVRVTATDASAAMVAAARAKVSAAGLGSQVHVRQLAIEELEPGLGTFDGLLSNFGGLNCAGDLASVARRTAALVRPGGRAFVCVMGPWVPWEWLWFLARGDLARAGRRLRGRATWRGLDVRYHSGRDVRRAFAPAFRATRVWALGALMPPPFAEAWALAHPRLASLCERAERRLETAWPLPALADHVVVELERTAA